MKKLVLYLLFLPFLAVSQNSYNAQRTLDKINSKLKSYGTYKDQFTIENFSSKKMKIKNQYFQKTFYMSDIGKISLEKSGSTSAHVVLNCSGSSKCVTFFDTDGYSNRSDKDKSHVTVSSKSVAKEIFDLFRDFNRQMGVYNTSFSNDLYDSGGSSNTSSTSAQSLVNKINSKLKLYGTYKDQFYILNSSSQKVKIKNEYFEKIFYFTDIDRVERDKSRVLLKCSGSGNKCIPFKDNNGKYSDYDNASITCSNSSVATEVEGLFKQLKNAMSGGGSSYTSNTNNYSSSGSAQSILDYINKKIKSHGVYGDFLTIVNSSSGKMKLRNKYFEKTFYMADINEIENQSGGYVALKCRNNGCITSKSVSGSGSGSGVNLTQISIKDYSVREDLVGKFKEFKNKLGGKKSSSNTTTTTTTNTNKSSEYGTSTGIIGEINKELRTYGVYEDQLWVLNSSTGDMKLRNKYFEKTFNMNDISEVELQKSGSNTHVKLKCARDGCIVSKSKDSSSKGSGVNVTHITVNSHSVAQELKSKFDQFRKSIRGGKSISFTSFSENDQPQKILDYINKQLRSYGTYGDQFWITDSNSQKMKLRNKYFEKTFYLTSIDFELSGRQVKIKCRSTGCVSSKDLDNSKVNTRDVSVVTINSDDGIPNDIYQKFKLFKKALAKKSGYYSYNSNTSNKTYNTTKTTNYTSNISSSTASTYYGISSSQKVSVFQDDFDTDRNLWYVGTDYSKTQAKLENGHFYYQSYAGSFTNSVQVDIDESKDFEIEARVKYVTTSDKNTYGNFLIWGGKYDPLTYHGFGFNGNGEYRGSTYNNSKYTGFIDWKMSSMVNKFSYNKLTVRKVGNYYYFFLNENFIKSVPYKPFFGSRVGFMVGNKSTIHVDYLKVYELKDKVQKKNAPPTLVITEPTSSRGFVVVSSHGIETTEKMIKVAGKVTDDNGVFEVVINGVEANLQSNGVFSANIPLAMGENTISVVAKDLQMLSTQEVIYVTRVSSTTTTSNVAQKRLALVIGNANYTHGGALKNPVNDANSIASALKALGFTVQQYANLSQGDMKRAVDKFGTELKNSYDVGLFFYAGHGLQVNGANYLVPTSANVQGEEDAEYECVNAGRILAKMESAKCKTNIVILDACRNNPFERSWSRSGGNGSGLAFMNAPSGSLIAYATAPGNTASDGSGSNGLYTEALLEEMKKSGMSILQMFQRVRAKVVERSNHEQTPWESTSLTGDFFFKK